MTLRATEDNVLLEWSLFVMYGKFESRSRPDDYSSPSGDDLEDCELVTLVEKVDRCFTVFLDQHDRILARGALLDRYGNGNQERGIPKHIPHQQVTRFHEQLVPVVAWWDRILGLRELEQLEKRKARMSG